GSHIDERRRMIPPGSRPPDQHTRAYGCAARRPVRVPPHPRRGDRPCAGRNPNSVYLRLHGCYSRPMPRAGWVKPETDQRLSDHISLGVLTRVFSPELVDRIVAEAGRTEVRHRLLPARVVVYYVLGLALFAQASYEEVMRNLVEGLSWASGWARDWKCR